ncbi:hypothetical protein NC653_012599 [Populus alba x Populus x berolinensis]|uniref:ZNF598/HEL2 PAH domain-containing protein n=1 Tax=Populus alba x Populus x berolinensis TaxID=444605 RepID=A0AAD6QSB6_9ROSI|nr:hypothetical protein NC653_012599 [Populus alba x Populus x berolinensis]
MDDTCAVCADTLEWVAYGPYLHKEVCFTCIIRLRFICNDFHCCICKSESNTIFVTKVVDGSESERGGFTGHPICEFCENPFYGDNELYLHLSTEHFTCHICPRQHPEQYEYFNSYDNLRHNAMEHGGCLSCSKRNAVLQIPTSFRFQQINEHYRHGSRSNPSSYQMNLPIVDSHLTANAERPCDISSNAQTVSTHREEHEIDIIVYPFESLATTYSEPPSRYNHVLGQNSRSVPMKETPFPPFSMAPCSSQQRSRNGLGGLSGNTMATCLHCQNMAGPSRTNGLLVSSDFASSSRTSNSNSKVSQGTVAPNPVDRASHKSLYSAPSLSRSASPLLKVEYVQYSNKALVEKIRAALEFNEEKFSAFKLISTEYLRDIIDTEEYLAYVHQFGLSHLVFELARLSPSVEKQRELVEIHNYTVGKNGSVKNGLSIDNGRSKSKKSSKKGKEKCDGNGITSSENILSDSLKVEILLKEGHHGGKGKSKILVDKQTNLNLSMEPKSEIVAQPDGVSSKKNVGAGGGGNKPKKKTSKFLKNRVGDTSAASLPNVGNSDADPDEKEEKAGVDSDIPELLPVHGVWRNGGGEKRVAMT